MHQARPVFSREKPTALATSGTYGLALPTSPATPLHAMHTENHIEPTMRRGHCARDAFTLVELLVCIAIIGILAAIIFPVVHLVKAKAMTARCASNLRQCGTAISLYAAEHRGYAPPSTWTLEIQAYLTPTQNKAGTNYTNTDVQFPISCPSMPYDDSKYGRSTYSLNSKLDPDGTSANVDPATGKTTFSWFMHLPSVASPASTIMLFDAKLNSTASQWASNATSGKGSVDFRHQGEVANVLFVDGHVTPMKSDDALDSMWSRDGGGQQATPGLD